MDEDFLDRWPLVKAWRARVTETRATEVRMTAAEWRALAEQIDGAEADLDRINARRLVDGMPPLSLPPIVPTPTLVIDFD